METGHELSDYALGGNVKPPVIAVASHHNGIPSLSLYDAATGSFVRQLSAHSGLIRSLAFADNGELLASAAEDQTVCLWRLTDLEKIVGQRGMAAGITVRGGDDGLIVKTSDDADGSLRDDDLVLGSVIDGKLQAFESPRDFYDAFWRAMPGETIRLRRARGGAAGEVDMKVAQGADDRKPLLSLFITRPAGGKRGWIGWSPQGPYQASDEEVERHLGWHFNTGRPEAPVAFAGAAQYREKYFREGLIDALIETGAPPEKQAVVLPRPTMELIVDGGELELKGSAVDIVVRTPPEKINLVLAGLPLDQIDKIELSLDGMPLAAPQRQTDGTTWSVALEEAIMRRGKHRLKALVRTREETPQQFTLERTLRYQGAPPQVNFALRGVAKMTAERADVTLEGMIEPGSAGENVEIIVRQLAGKEGKVVKEWATDKPLEVSEALKLAEGGNIIEIVAKNRDALAGYEYAEMSRVELTANYSPQAALPTLDKVTILAPGEGGLVRTIDTQAGPTVVNVDKIQLEGEHRGASGNLQIESSLGGAAAELKVAPATGGKPSKFATDPIELKPGVQTLVLPRKGAPDGPMIATAIQIDYRPPLPELTFASPRRDAVLTAGTDEPKIALAAKLSAVSHRHPFTAEILVNGEKLDIEPKIDIAAGTLSAEVPLALGENEIAVRLANEWNPPSERVAAVVKYLSLPTIEKFDELGEVTSPVVDVVVSGRSALPITAVEVAVALMPTMRLAEDAITFDKEAGTWRATIKAVPLLRDAHEIAVRAWNEHGAVVKPGAFDLPAWRQLEPPPQIELSEGGKVTRPKYEMPLTVRSKTPLKSLQIQQDKSVVNFDARLADIKADAAGWYTFKADVPIKLATGVNRLVVTAANEGGSETAQSLVTYIDPPALVFIDRIESADLPQKVSLPIITKDQQARARGPSPTAKVMVSGRVEWTRSTDKEFLQRLQRLQVWVNGFQQAPVDIKPPAPGSLTSNFSAFVVLNQREDNHIEFAVPDLTADIATLFDAYVDCEAPILEQRLHLLVVGVGSPPGSEAELKSEVLAAIKARQSDRGLRTAAFDRIAIYGPLVGADITPQQVRTQLANIKVKIDELYRANKSSNRPANDVVMIYLQGGALAHTERDFYVTTRPTSDPRTARALAEREPRLLRDVALGSNTLVEFLTYTTGAHVLMLDVAGSTEADAAAEWPNKSQAAMLRYTWLKESATPAKARLLASLPEAIEQSAELRQLDASIAKIHLRLASEYPGSTAYRRRVPTSLEDLMLGETAQKSP